MDFDGWNTHSGNGIPQRNACMGIGGGVENDYAVFSLCLLDPANQFALEIRLTKINFNTQGFCTFTDFGFNVRQSGVSVHIWLTLSE